MIIKNVFTGRGRSKARFNSSDLDDRKKACKTVQSLKKTTDINHIIKRHAKTGLLFATKAKGVYGDFSELKDFHTSQQRNQFAINYFNSLPSNIRTKFNNNLKVMLDWIADPENKNEAIELGLLKADITPTIEPDGSISKTVEEKLAESNENNENNETPE